MKATRFVTVAPVVACLPIIFVSTALTAEFPKACIDGTGPGWKALGQEDFTNVNCHEDTWTWKDGVAHCSGQPIGVIRTKKMLTNFELVAQWRHLKPGGNSGFFVWVTEESLQGVPPGKLPLGGIEVQVLDPGFTEQYLKKYKNKKADWFTTHGDVFAVGTSKMTPFPPISPDGSRSFPTKELTKSVPEWNHYYIRSINGEVRLWVNGDEVSGGKDCQPCGGYLCLESEGSPVEYKELYIRELP